MLSTLACRTRGDITVRFLLVVITALVGIDCDIIAVVVFIILHASLLPVGVTVEFLLNDRAG